MRTPSVPMLPPDDDHPTRPDWPIVRHLTYTEAHALELGVGLAVLAWVAWKHGALNSVLPLAVFAARVILGLERRDSAATPATHTVGVHDIRREPGYFVTGAVATAAVLVVGGWVFSALPV